MWIATTENIRLMYTYRVVSHAAAKSRLFGMEQGEARSVKDPVEMVHVENQ